jgi:hypothetical protein
MIGSVLRQLIEASERGAVEDIRTILQSHPELVGERDETGASALHYAAFGGHQDAVRALVAAGADINAIDAKFHATPAGWAIEYLRELGGFLGIELRDFAWAIENGHTEWVARFLKRFPALRDASDTQGRPFKELAERSANAEIKILFADPSQKNAPH